MESAGNCSAPFSLYMRLCIAPNVLCSSDTAVGIGDSFSSRIHHPDKLRLRVCNGLCPPVSFGISQCLIVVRVAIVKEFNQSRGSGTRVPVFVMSNVVRHTPILSIGPRRCIFRHDVSSDYAERPEEHTLAAWPHSRTSPSPEPILEDMPTIVHDADSRTSGSFITHCTASIRLD